MKKPLPRIIAEKREWHHQPTEEEKARGFKGWYSRGYLPHFDAPGALQFITLPAGRFYSRGTPPRVGSGRETGGRS